MTNETYDQRETLHKKWDMSAGVTEGGNPTGYCPDCGKPGVERERRPNGNDRCEGGHTYPSSTSLEYPGQAACNKPPVARCGLIPIAGPDDLIVHDLCVFKGTLFAATDRGLMEMVDDKLVRVLLVEEEAAE